MKDGRPDSLKLTYYEADSITGSYSEWLCFEHGGYAAKRAAQKWARLGGSMPVPATVADAIERFPELEAPDEIQVKKEGKYWRVL
jgi:DNA repair protein RadD